MLQTFLQQGLADAITNGLFMTATLTIGTSTFTVARDSAVRMLPFEEGGQDAQATCSVLCKTADVTAINADPYKLIGTLATMDGRPWRIADDLNQGPAGIRLTLIDANQ